MKLAISRRTAPLVFIVYVFWAALGIWALSQEKPALDSPAAGTAVATQPAVKEWKKKSTPLYNDFSPRQQALLERTPQVNHQQRVQGQVYYNQLSRKEKGLRGKLIQNYGVSYPGG